jgi:predicted O-linked N-acetylglucosamine transferase (SPINDLY family)
MTDIHELGKNFENILGSKISLVQSKLHGALANIAAVQNSMSKKLGALQASSNAVRTPTGAATGSRESFTKARNTFTDAETPGEIGTAAAMPLVAEIPGQVVTAAVRPDASPSSTSENLSDILTVFSRLAQVHEVARLEEELQENRQVVQRLLADQMELEQNLVLAREKLDKMDLEEESDKGRDKTFKLAVQPLLEAFMASFPTNTHVNVACATDLITRKLQIPPASSNRQANGSKQQVCSQILC